MGIAFGHAALNVNDIPKVDSFLAKIVQMKQNFLSIPD